MAVVVQDLVTKFSFLGSLNPLAKNNLLLGGTVKLLGHIPKSLDVAVAAFTFFANRILTTVDALDQLSRQTRIAVGNIQELNFIAGQTQSTSAAMESTLRSLSSTIGSAAQKGSEDFARLGISVRDANGQVKNADVILDEVRQRFVALNLSIQEQEHFASALGIDTSLLQLLNKTNSEMAGLRDRARELGTLTAEQTEQANEYKKSLNSMWFSLNSVKQLVAIGVAPELGRLADNFAQLLADNREWIVDGIQFAIEWIGNLTASFNRMLPLFAGVAAGFVLLKGATLAWGLIMGTVSLPFTAIAAGVAALYLVVDDLIVAFQGGHSVIADFFQNAFGIDAVDELTESFKLLMKYAINPVIKLFKDLWALWQKIVGGITSGGAAIARLFGAGGSNNIPIGAGTGGSNGSTSNQVNQNVDIQIKTNDPLAAGRAVQDGLQRQLDNANTQLGVGGR